MLTDRDITISTAPNRFAKRLREETLLWSALAARLMAPRVGRETVAEYRALPRAEQDRLKDVGGFVGGALREGRRTAASVITRDVVTLDLDCLPPGGDREALERLDALGCAYALYSTRRHTKENPRLRVVIPLDGPCAPEEYEPIARRAAQLIGVDWMDPTTYEASRLMYWPSRCSDGEFVCRVGEGEMLDIHGQSPLAPIGAIHGKSPLSLNSDIPPYIGGVSNCRSRAMTVEPAGARDCGSKAAAPDPAGKPGVVGEFCRRYDVLRAMEELIPGVYRPTGMPGRYTYAAGSTEGGAVVYDGGKFLYSFHATDPCSLRLVNSYDMVRLHRFGRLDAGRPAGTKRRDLPSEGRMRPYARKLLGKGREAAMSEHGKAACPTSGRAEGAEDWKDALALREGSGATASTVDNVALILEHDPKLCRAVEYDEFSGRAYVTGSLPWKEYPGWRRVWGETDDSQLIRYLEKDYGIVGDQKVRHGLAACLDGRAVNFVRQYLESLRWDGVPRLDTLFIHYLGAEDTGYARAAARKAFTAAAARVYTPGVQYDYMPILCGKQGIGKSTVLRVMGGEWYCDSLCSFSGRDAGELIQGNWIIELGELAALARAEIDAVKHFITKRDDQFRAPYARRPSVYPRRCVFFGTTNRKRHLTDTTGNRRFLPLDCDAARRVKSPWKDLPRERDQLWAEAVWRWREREPLFLPPELEAEAARRQRDHLAQDPRAGMVTDFLARRLPPGWMNRSLTERLAYWDAPMDDAAEAVNAPRKTVSRQEIWAECFRRDPGGFDARGAADIDCVMACVPGWARHPSSFRNGPYGTERGFARTETEQNYI